MNERQALALLESGKPLRDLVREHAHDLEVHMDAGRGMIAREVELSEDGNSVIATGIAQDAKGPVKITIESSVETAELWIREAVDMNWGQKAALFLAGRGGSRKAVFSRRLTSPSTKAERKFVPAELIARANEVK